MKPRCLGRSPITQVNYQCNNYTVKLSSHSDLCHIHKTFYIGLVKHYRKNNENELPQRHWSEPAPVKHDRYEVEKAVNLVFSQPPREPLYGIRWTGSQPSQDQWINSDDIDDAGTFKSWQEDYLKPTWQRRSYHRDRTGPRKWSETLAQSIAERNRVMQGMMRTFTVRFEDPVADLLFNFLMKG